MKTFFPRMAAAADPVAAGSGTGATGAGAAVAAGASAGGGAQPAPYYADLIGKDGSLNHASFERLPENLKSLAPSLANVKTVDDLFAKVANLNGLAGRKALAPLPADAKPEDVAAQQAVLRAVIGVPEKPEGYGFTRPNEVPEAAWDPEFAKAAQEILHKHNGSPALAKELLGLQTKMVQANIAAQQEYETNFFKQQDQDFRAALTRDGLDYDKTMAFIERTAATFGLAKDDVLLKNATVRLMLNKVGKAIGEDKFVGGEGSGANTKSDRATAEDIIHNKQNPDYAIYWDANHPKNREVVKRVNALLEAAAIAERAAAGAAKR